MADTKAHIPAPPVMWAQRKDKIYLTINLEDCKKPKIELTETQLYFRCKGGTDNTDHEVTIKFYKPVIPEESKYLVHERNIPFVLKKKEEGDFWPRLLEEKTKVHWLKTDFDKWKDEDDSDYEDEPDKMDLEAMMQSMGGMGGAGMGGMGDMAGLDDQKDLSDSDDDELPDLE